MEKFKEIFIGLVQYGFPTIAIILSIISFIDSRKAGKIKDKLNHLEEKLKKYELEEKEKQLEEAKKSNIQARVVRISKGNYRMKIWNSGKATAYNVDLVIPQEYEGIVWKTKVPYEFLESGDSFQEVVLVHSDTPDKFMITTKWNDKEGYEHRNKQMISIN